MPGFIYPPYSAMRKAILIAIYIYIVLPASIYGSESTTENIVDELLQSFNVPDFIQHFDLCTYEKELLQQRESDLSKQMVLYQQQEQELDQCGQELNYLDHNFKKCDRKLDHLDNKFKESDRKLDECDGNLATSVAAFKKCDGELTICKDQLPEYSVTDLLGNIELQDGNSLNTMDYWTIGTPFSETKPTSSVLHHFNPPDSANQAIVWITSLPTVTSRPTKEWFDYTITVIIETGSIFGLIYEEESGQQHLLYIREISSHYYLWMKVGRRFPHAKFVQAPDQLMLTVTVNDLGVHSAQANGLLKPAMLSTHSIWFTSTTVAKVGFFSNPGTNVVVSNLEIVFGL